MVFNEDDKVLMKQVADTIAKLVFDVFPSSVNVGDEIARLNVSPVHHIGHDNLQTFTELIDDNIGSLYASIQGANWKVEKLHEMQEPGLIYISYETNALIAFISVMLVIDDGIKKLYLYEIHVNRHYQHIKLGGLLMSHFHKLAKYLDSLHDAILSCKGTSLTVFSANTIPYNWYVNLGYVVTPNSPKDRVLRSGKIIKPDYYLMTRDNEP